MHKDFVEKKISSIKIVYVSGLDVQFCKDIDSPKIYL